MINQIKMYQMFFNNQDYVNYLTSTYYTKAMPNETVYLDMQQNSLYAKYLCENNKELKQKEVESLLNKFKNKFWLEDDITAVTIFLQFVKNKTLKANEVFLIFNKSTFINNLLEFVNKQYLQKNINLKFIEKVEELINENLFDAIKLISKKEKLFKKQKNNS